MKYRWADETEVVTHLGIFMGMAGEELCEMVGKKPGDQNRTKSGPFAEIAPIEVLYRSTTAGVTIQATGLIWLERLPGRADLLLEDYGALVDGL